MVRPSEYTPQVTLGMIGEVVLKVGYMATYLDQDIHVQLHRNSRN